MANRFTASSPRARATSPVSGTLNVSRAQEKEQLETLNNRLAVYIDSVRRLENENRDLKITVESFNQSYSVETSKVKQLYERELDDAKKLIEELAREKSRLEIEAEKAKAEAEDALTKLGKRERDLRNAENRLKQYETEIGELKSRNELLVHESNRKSDDNVNLRGLNNDLEKQINTLKRQLEAETLLRIDLENKNKTLREQIQFNQQLHETTLEEVRLHKRTETRSVDNGLRKQYDDRLIHELQQLRTQTDQEIQSIRDELADQYEKKIDDLQGMLRRQSEQFGSYRTDASSYRERIDEIAKARDALNEKVIFLEQRVKDLEDRLHRNQQRSEDSLAERDEDILRLKQQIEQMQIDYQNLLDIKIGLDREIATYRKLLESEEERLNISGSSRFTMETFSDSSIGSGSFFENNQHQTRPKRARYEQEERSTVVHQTSEGIKIVEDDSSHPKFIKLINATNQDYSMSGWILKRKIGSQSFEFKFPRSMILKAGATSTIWSSEVNDISVDPPTNLKLRTPKWFSTNNETKRTILEDTDGKVIAEKIVVNK